MLKIAHVLAALLVGALFSGCEVNQPPSPAVRQPSTKATAAAQKVQPPGAQAGDTIKVASFNIQVFGTSKLKKPQVMDVLVKVIRRFDVVAIQEVRSWERAAEWPGFRAGCGPHLWLGGRLHAVARVKPSHSSRYQKAELCVVLRGGCQVGPQGRSVLSIIARRASGAGRRRLFAQRLRYSPRLGLQAHVRMPPHLAVDPRNALQNEGRGVSRLAKNRQPRHRRGADWAPHAA
jgi:hypothetical protein